MELVFGPEPVPGDPATPIDELEVLRWMNLARSLAPGRFENAVDDARFARRRAADAAEKATVATERACLTYYVWRKLFALIVSSSYTGDS